MMKKPLFLLIISLSLLIQNEVFAEIKTKDVVYKEENTILQGYLAYDGKVKGKVPAVLIVHEWTGLGDYVKGRARQIAQLGYVAFAIDIYGKDVRPKNREEAGREASIYRKDRKLMLRRARAGLDQLKKFDFVDPAKIAAIGYCFGGGVVLEMARNGEDLSGVVSFHGSLDTPEPASKNIRAKILVLHGADDRNIAGGELALFEDEMRAAEADWQVVLYGNAVHAFTNPDSGNDPSKGAAYNANADKRSWEMMRSFFKEIF